MNNYDLMNILGNAFVYGELDSLKEHLAEDCEYVSEYANKHIFTSKEIINRMDFVYSNLDLKSRYKYKIVPIQDIIKNDKSVKEQQKATNNEEYAILLYQYNDEYPVAVVSTEIEQQTGKITKILLSRNSEIYNVDFYRADMGEDSPLDVPSTVKALSSDVLWINFVNFNNCANPEDYYNETIYIWKKADEYIKNFLLDMGYRIIESQIFEDCIGYKTVRNNCVYTIYMFAYGKKKSTVLNGNYCKKYLDYKFSENSKVLFVCLNVKRFRTGKKIEYEFKGFRTRIKTDYDFLGYYADENYPEFLSVILIKDKYLLVNYSEEENIDILYKMLSAFNNDSIDIYEIILSVHSRYSELIDIHKRFGDMHLAYVCENNSVYSPVSYIENYGYFKLLVSDDGKMIYHWIFYPFDENKIKNIIRREEQNRDIYKNIPFLMNVEPFPPDDTERFALKLFFDNGECKKYVLPIERQYEKDDVVEFQSHVFTDKIWQSAVITNDCSPKIEGYSYRFPKIKFKNDFLLSSLRCYFDGTEYSEPEPTNDVIYEDEKCILKRIWKWNVNSILEAKESVWDENNIQFQEKKLDILKVLTTGWAFNGLFFADSSHSTFADKNGKRLCSIDFDFIDDFEDGYARVAKKGYGFGFIDEKMNIVIPMQYECAENFINGFAKVKQNDKWFLINKQQNKVIEFKSKIGNKEYQRIDDYYEGRCKVSTQNINLAYASDYDDIAGIWGFINEKGEELIAPQYIYANDFGKGIAIVCKGKWTKEGKWKATGKYWTDTELWGAIDKNGNEAIPFIFDEIIEFYEFNEAFIAHYGGWENGRWGVIDRTGKWLAKPIFEKIDYNYYDGMFAFYKEDKSYSDDIPLGVYDIKQQKVLFEPQFLDVYFLKNGYIIAEVFDENLGRKIEKIFDRNGKELFQSEYSSINDYKGNNEILEVSIDNEKGRKCGLIDKNGKVLYPCEKNIEKFFYQKRLIIFKDKDKVGLKDFDGKIIIPPAYSVISNLDKDFYTIQIKEDNNRREGLITPEGKVIVPTEFESISWLQDGKHVLCCKEGFCQMLEYIE